MADPDHPEFSRLPARERRGRSQPATAFVVFERDHAAFADVGKPVREAFPDLSLERTADLVADGDVVMFRWMCEGTHTGPAFYDLPMGSLPDTSDREMRFSGMTAIRLKEEKIIEEIGLADGVTALNQLRFIRVHVWPS